MSRAAVRAKASLERAAARDRTLAARRNLVHLRTLVKGARASRAHAIRAVVEHCRAARMALRARLHAERVRVLGQLRAQVLHERQAVQVACVNARTLARSEGDASIANARAAYIAAVTAERQHRNAMRKPRAERVRSSAAERRSESDDAVRANLPPELLDLFEAVKGKIRASDHMSRTEAFLHYVEENPAEALELAQDKADAFVKEHERAEREAAAVYKAAQRDEKKPRRSSAASRTRPLLPASDRTIQSADAFEFGHNAPPSIAAPSMPAPRHEAAPVGARPSPPPRRSSAPPRPSYAGEGLPVHVPTVNHDRRYVVIAHTEERSEPIPGQSQHRVDLGERPRMHTVTVARAAVWKFANSLTSELADAVTTAKAYARKEYGDRGLVLTLPASTPDPIAEAKAQALAARAPAKAPSMPAPRHSSAPPPKKERKARKPTAKQEKRTRDAEIDKEGAEKIEAYRAGRSLAQPVVLGVPDAHEGAHGWRVRDLNDPAGVVATFSSRAAAERAAKAGNKRAGITGADITRAKLRADMGYLSGANLSPAERERAIQAENDRNLSPRAWRAREREARDAERAKARRGAEERGDQLVTVAYTDRESQAVRAIVYATAAQDDLIRVAGEAKSWADDAGGIFTRAQVKAWPATKHTNVSAIREAIATYRRAPPP